jgi:PAS domain S-box-containing protein
MIETNKADFQHLIENSNDLFSTWNLDTTITYLSPYFTTLTGYGIEDILGQSFVPLVHPDDVTICRVANDRVYRTNNKVSDVEFRLVHQAGHSIWVNASLAPIINAAGEFVAFQGIMRDITAQKQIESQLREQVQLNNCQAQIGTVLTRTDGLQAVLQQCTLILVDCLGVAFARIWTVSEDGQTLELQASAGLYNHIDGAHGRIPIGQFKIGLIAQEKSPHLTNDVLSDPRVSDRRWAAQEGMVAFAGYPLMIGDRVLGVVALFAKHPLSENTLELLHRMSNQISLGVQRYQFEAQLRQQTTTLRQTLQELQQNQSHLIQSEKMSSLGEMVAGVAHEINNPVNFIHGNLNYVKSYSADLIELVKYYQKEVPTPSRRLQDFLEGIDLNFILADFPPMLNSMKLGTERIREIVLTLRNFSRLDEAAMKEVDIHDGINSTLLMLQHKLKATNDRPEIQISTQYTNLPQVNCYAGQLNQVFMNLLANAIDALDQYLDLPPVITIITSLTSENTIAIRIQDNGAGIPEAIQSRLFDPFFTTKSVGQGTGLGLSISYQIIVDQHQGKITCDSTIGEGTSFTVTLPIGQTRS